MGGHRDGGTALLLDVDTSSLATAASDLAGAADIVATAAGDVTALGDVADTDVRSGLEALTVAWGAALEVLGEDVQYLSQRTGQAAEVYDSTDQCLAEGISRRGPR
jgi:hypothetical protein